MELGIRLKSLRQQMGLTQKELADKAELSKGFISQLENDMATPSLQTLEEILECLDSDMSTFFRNVPGDALVFPQAEMQVEENGTQTMITLVPPSARRTMHPVRIMLAPGGFSVPGTLHDGERFGYVIEGSVELTAGERHKQLRSGDAFYICAGTAHYLRNTGQTPAELLWVSAPPNF